MMDEDRTGLPQGEENGLTAPFDTMAERQRGYEAHYGVTDRMTVTQYHCHDYYEIYIHLRGGEFMGVDDRLYRLMPNHLFIIPPFTMHGLSCTEEMRGYERAFLNISPEVLQTLGCGQIELDRFFQAQAAKGLNTYRLSGGDAEQLVGWIRELKEHAGREDTEIGRFLDYSMMVNVMTLVCRTMRSVAPAEGTEVSSNVVQRVLTYINSHYTQPIRVSDLARRFSVSESYLSHEFSRFTHRSIYEYVLYRRVMLARKLMLQQTSLNAIAFQCGFNDYSNFLRSFTRMMGISPSRYRKQLRVFRNVEEPPRGGKDWPAGDGGE